MVMASVGMNLGSPPRVRSRPCGLPCGTWLAGITSACAEQTVAFSIVADLARITSACAEQTVVFYCVLSQLNGVEYLIYALRRVS